MSKTKYELHITGECKQNLKLCKKRGLPYAGAMGCCRKTSLW